MNTDINNADTLLEELKNLNNTLKAEIVRERSAITEEETNESIITLIPSASSVPSVPIIAEPVLDEDGLSKFILETSQKIIKTGLETIESLKTTIAATEDAKSMQGFAEIVTATNNVINTLNTINIEKRKAATAKEIKTMDIEARKQLKPATKVTNNNLNLIASREQIVKMLEEVEANRSLPDATKTIDVVSEDQ
jgi:hypothetical protein